MIHRCLFPTVSGGRSIEPDLASESSWRVCSAVTPEKPSGGTIPGYFRHVRGKTMDPADLQHHISRRYNEQLEQVHAHVLAMGGLVEQQLQRALRALIDGDGSLAMVVEAEELQ